jgi:uncharacterized protein
VPLSRPGDADAFLARAERFLLEREAEHNLLLGLAGRLRAQPRLYGHDPYFAVLETGGRVVGAALRTPPHNLALSEIDDLASLPPLVVDLHATYGSLPGVLGPKVAAAELARLWEAATGVRGRLAVSKRIYRASGAEAPADVPGRPRPYAAADRAVVVAWLVAFAAEAHPHEAPDDPQELVERRLADPAGGFLLWDDGGAVSLAGYGAPTAHGIRVGPVYTPPALRGRGYASALVAELTRDLLAGGHGFCCLFTDLANTTSNRIYQRVGYRGVTDVDQWAFD